MVEALDPMTLQHCCEEENKDEIVPNEGHGVKLLHNELVSSVRVLPHLGSPVPLQSIQG